jgi:hypothetical protein
MEANMAEESGWGGKGSEGGREREEVMDGRQEATGGRGFAFFFCHRHETAARPKPSCTPFPPPWAWYAVRAL